MERKSSLMANWSSGRIELAGAFCVGGRRLQAALPESNTRGSSRETKPRASSAQNLAGCREGDQPSQELEHRETEKKKKYQNKPEAAQVIKSIHNR